MEGKSYLLSKIDATIDGKEQSVNVEYKLNDGEYTLAQSYNDGYKIDLTQKGALYIRVIVTIENGETFERIYEVSVYEKPAESFVPDISWEESLM